MPGSGCAGEAAAGTGEPELLQSRQGRVLVLTMNRPHRRNALSPTLYLALRHALRAAADDDAVGAVVLTGAGGAFSAGGDVSRMAASSAGARPGPEERLAQLRERMQVGELLHTMDKPTIAMVRGPAIGAGLSIALACDLRFADTSAKFRTGFLPLALPGDHGGHYYLPRIVGPAKARELYLLSPTLDAAQALQIGLVTQVVEPGGLEPHVMRVATGLAEGPALATAQMKRNLHDGLALPLVELLDAEARRHVLCTDSDEHKEAVRAYTEKRPPRYRP